MSATTPAHRTETIVLSDGLRQELEDLAHSPDPALTPEHDPGVAR